MCIYIKRSSIRENSPTKSNPLNSSRLSCGSLLGLVALGRELGEGGDGTLVGDAGEECALRAVGGVLCELAVLEGFGDPVQDYVTHAPVDERLQNGGRKGRRGKKGGECLVNIYLSLTFERRLARRMKHDNNAHT